jgi:hypothetical protein
MNAKWKLIVAVAVLILLGGGISAYKTYRLGVPFWRGEQVHDWQVEARITFFATGKRVKARLSLPAIAVEEKSGRESGSLGYHYHIEPDHGEYTAVWSAEEREEAQALVFPGEIPRRLPQWRRTHPGEAPELDAPGLGGTLGEAAKTIVNRATSITADPESLFIELFDQINSGLASQEFMLVKSHYAKEFPDNGMILMGIDLLAMAGVPARMAYGVRLDEEAGPQPGPVALVEYFDGAYWKVRDPLEPGAVLDGARPLSGTAAAGPCWT